MRKFRTWLHIGSPDAPFILANLFKSEGNLVKEIKDRKESHHQWRVANGWVPAPESKEKKEPDVLDVTDMLRPTMGDYWRPRNRLLHFQTGPIEVSIKREDLSGLFGAEQSLDLLLKDIKGGQRLFKHTPLYARAMDPIGTTAWLTRAEQYYVIQYADGLDCSLCSEEARTIEGWDTTTASVINFVKAKGECICEEGLVTLYIGVEVASIEEDSAK